MLTFINPVLVSQMGDVMGSGIPYMPHILAYTVGLLKDKNLDCQIIDAFGLNPEKITRHGDFYWQGLTIDEVVARINDVSEIVFIYSSAITNVDFNIQLIKCIKKKFSKIKIGILGNTQAVTSFDVTILAKEFLDSGADVLVYNDIENTTLGLVEKWLKLEINIVYKKSEKVVKMPMSQKIGETEKLIVPAWDLFPLEKYWKLGYSHGPMQGKYLPLMTSYGCPYRCKFCVNPGINKSRWQAKPAHLVLKEIEILIDKFGVREFHFEDLDPTVDKVRIKELCKLIIKNKLDIKWKIVSGTKVETIDEETLILMGESGCKYVSISPETGSKRVLRLMNKPFNYEHASWFIERCSQLKIKTQACFVIGFPGESRNDRLLTETYVKFLTKIGVDEIALFIATPLPGSEVFNKLNGFKQFSDLTFSPKWRKGFEIFSNYRAKLYVKFIWWKFLYYPVKIVEQGLNMLFCNFETKMEMIFFRIIKFNWLLIKSDKKA